MISNIDILRTYLEKGKGLRILKGNSLEILLPYLCLDIVLQNYRTWILPIKENDLPNNRRGSQYSKFCDLRNNWNETQQALLQPFFRLFEEKDDKDNAKENAVIAKMDDFEEAIDNYQMITKVAIMKVIDPVPLEEQQVIVACLLCEILLWTSMEVWKKTIKDKEEPQYRYEDGKMVRYVVHPAKRVWCKFTYEYRMLDRLRHDIHKLLNFYYKPTKRITIGENPLCMNEIEVLCRKITNYLLNDSNNDKIQTNDNTLLPGEEETDCRT